jgi:hypothetical protein
MFKFLQLNPKLHSIVVRIVSSVIFALLFISILAIAEWQYPNKVLNNLMYYVDKYLLMGL